MAITCTCPEEPLLAAYVIGGLTADDQDAIDAHLEECAACLEAIDRIDKSANRVFESLCQSRTSTILENEPALTKLVEQVKRQPTLGVVEPAVGDVLGSYHLLELIGAGGMGRVFRAEHLKMKRQVALKVMSAELIPSPEARARFQREVEAVARLKSPHIVAAFDAGECGGRDFLVMEYVEGRTLDKATPLGMREALNFTLQAARGLEDAHAAGIIHRDIKPANLLVDQIGQVKILDLGLARLTHDDVTPLDTSPDRPRDLRLTGATSIMGTAAYMAPEQASAGQPVDGRADIYSLGCSLYFLLTGEPPFHGDTALDVVRAHRDRPVPSVRAERPDCPRRIDLLCQAMMAKSPAHRPASMREVAVRLEKAFRYAPLSLARVWRTPLVLGLAAAILLAVGFVAWSGFFGQQDSPKNPGGAAAEVKKPAIEMVALKPGEFWMGSSDTDRDAAQDEKPRHKVKITQPFLLGKTKVTQAQWEEVMGKNPSAFSPKGRKKDKVKDTDTSQHPVDSVSWLDAVAFCNRLSERHELKPYYRINGDSVTIAGGDGFRLPTEAEWEFACRAGTSSRWYFGESPAELGEHAWFSENSDGTTHPVGLKKANPWGLFDMLGNVPEHCWDRYDGSYYERSPDSDPPGSGKGTTRVHRGGGWNLAAAQNRPAAREALGNAYDHLTIVGLRVARNLEGN